MFFMKCSDRTREKAATLHGENYVGVDELIERAFNTLSVIDKIVCVIAARNFREDNPLASVDVV